MAGTKLTLAKSAVEHLVGYLDETDYMSLITFDSTPIEWREHNNSYAFEMPSSDNYTLEQDSSDNHLQEQDGDSFLRCDNHTLDEVTLYLEGVNITYGTVADLPLAIEKAVSINSLMSSTPMQHTLPMIIILTDGRSVNADNAETVRKEIRSLNKIPKIPIFSLGIGFDANMNILEDIAGG